MLTSLRGRLVVAMLVIQLATLALVIGNGVRLVDALMGAVLEAKRVELQTLLSVALARPMFEQDPATVQAVLKQIAGHETVNGVEVLDADGHRVAAVDHRHEFEERPHIVPSEVSTFSSPLRLAGHDVGLLNLNISNGPLIAAKEALLGQSVAISTAAAAAGLMAMLLVAGLLTRDLRALRMIAGRVAGGDYTPRLMLRGASETSAVAAAFNSMLEAIGRERDRLRASEARLEAAQRIAKVGCFERNKETGYAYWTEELYRLQGLDPSTPVPDLDEIVSFIHPDDRARFREASERAHAEGKAWESEYRAIRADGDVRWQHLRAEWTVDDDGRPIALLGTVQDITERTEAEYSLRKIAEQLSETESLAHVGSFTRDLETGTATWSDEMYRIFGVPRSLPALDIDEIEARAHPEDLERFRVSRATALRDNTPWQGTFRFYRADGAVRFHHVHAQTRPGPDGQPDTLIGAVQDVTERTIAEQDLRKTAQQLAEAERLAHVGYWEWGPDSDRREWSEEVFRILDLPPEEGATLDAFMSRVHPQDRAAVAAETTRNVEKLMPIQHSYRIVTRDGAVRHVETIAQPIVRADGTVEKIVGAMRDISEQVDAADRVRRSEATLRAVFENLPAAAALKDTDGRYIVANGRYDEWFGTPPRDMIGKTAYEVFAGEDDTERAVAMDRAAAERKAAVQEDFEFNFADGSRRPCMALKFPVTGGDGEPIGIGLLVFDISERKRTREALERSEGRLRALFENALDVIAIIDDEGTILMQSPSAEAVLGYAEEDAVGHPCFDFVHPDDIDATRQALADAQRAPGQTVNLRARIRHKDGRWRTLDFLARNAPDVSGINGIAIVGRDVTERLRLEEQLLQAQKMEAVGQLTGGLAHDFNNLLAIVIINLELAREDIADTDPVVPLLDKAVRAANRGASLTDRLLAFSRRQALSPRVIQPNDAIAQLLDLMTATLGNSIELRCRPAQEVWRTKVDIAQLENALLNLTINARDAMADGGVLTIITANRALGAVEAAAYDVAPGDYVEITVADSGGGIPPDILDRVAEPFFTTKDVGSGSGLGLSMAYGFARQSGGHLAIASTPGDGTTVSLLLPRTSEALVPEPAPGQVPTVAAREARAILVVEDDPDVRTATVANLKRLGYAVVAAADAAEALNVLASDRELALLFTDIVLPGGVNGIELATRARDLRHSLPVLLASGYADQALPADLVHHGVPLLKKPYRTVALAQAAYDCLNDGDERSKTAADRR